MKSRVWASPSNDIVVEQLTVANGQSYPQLKDSCALVFLALQGAGLCHSFY